MLGPASLEGRVALVTGAGAGLGRAIAAELAARGADVAVTGRSPGSIAETAEQVRAAGGSARSFTLDVASGASVEAAVGEITASLGRIDIVINNAGVLDAFLPAIDTSEALWDEILTINLKGQFLVARAVLPQMVRRRSGVFVNMASAAGTVGGMGGTAYTSSKHGVIGLTRQMAVDYGPHGVRANALCPGSIDTEMSRVFLAENPDVVTLVNSVPAGRQGSPEEIARLAAFLAGDEAPFMTGAVLTIDGGWTTR